MNVLPFVFAGFSEQFCHRVAQVFPSKFNYFSLVKEVLPLLNHLVVLCCVLFEM